MTAAAPPAIAVAQFAPGEDVEANRATIVSLVEAAAARGAGLVLLPEYSTHFTLDKGEKRLRHAEPLDGPSVTAFAELADRLGVVVVAGLTEIADDPDHVRNTVVAVGPGEGVVARYRKLHLYDAFGHRESDWVQAGDIAEPEVFSWGGFTVGIQTCYDIRFPEVSRRIVDAGADLVLVPAEWVAGPLKEHHWRTLLTARALENTAYFAAADHTPPVGVGTSLVIDPMGVAVAALGEAPGIAVAELDPERVRAVRELNPALRLRRFGVAPR